MTMYGRVREKESLRDAIADRSRRARDVISASSREGSTKTSPIGGPPEPVSLVEQTEKIQL